MAEPMFTTMTKGKGDARDRRDVADEVEIELVVERRIACVRRRGQQQCIAVGWRTNDRFGTDIGAPARTVLNDEWLAQALRQPLAHQARQDIRRAAGSRRDDDPDWPRWIALRPSDTRHGRQRGSARDEMEKISTGKFHSEPPFTSFDHLVGAGEQRR